MRPQTGVNQVLGVNTVLLQTPEGWMLFRKPLRVLIADSCDQVPSVFKEMEACLAEGQYAAGYLGYEASAAFDPACITHEASSLPVMWFGIFKDPEVLKELPASDHEFKVASWQSSVTREDHAEALGRIKRYINMGETYQVNYTMRLRSAFEGDPYSLFAVLCRAQQAEYSAFIRGDGFCVCSASPELFFDVNGNCVRSRPMKGTAKRGFTLESDRKAIRELRESEKNRAENVMIVDMVRNDLGRVAVPGTVEVTSSFDVERYPTLLQMTSTVEARTTCGIRDLFSAIFPCASITGAPKIRTMEIIRDMERGPRGVYTGSIGYVSPNFDSDMDARRAQFNVAIRTVVIDESEGKAEYGVGGGIVWDSSTEAEYSECLTKTQVLTKPYPEFDLLETMRWESGKGYILESLHLARMRRSAEYFSYPFAASDAMRLLERSARNFNDTACRVRLLMDRSGGFTLQASSLGNVNSGPIRLCFAAEPVDKDDPFLYHKTTHRVIYERCMKTADGVDDVILFNGNGDVTESTIANIVLENGGIKTTPPVTSGLLPGTFRQHLLDRGEIVERIVTRKDVMEAENIWLINSVRGWMRAEVS